MAHYTAKDAICRNPLTSASPVLSLCGRLPLIEGSVKEVALDRGAVFEFAAQADDHADKAR